MHRDGYFLIYFFLFFFLVIRNDLVNKWNIYPIISFIIFFLKFSMTFLRRDRIQYKPLVYCILYHKRKLKGNFMVHVQEHVSSATKFNERNYL